MPSQTLSPRYDDVTQLIGRLGRATILDKAAEGERPAVAAILDDLEQTGLIAEKEGRLEWNGPESREILRRLATLRDGPARSLVAVPLEGDSPVSVRAVPDGSVADMPHLTAWGGAAGTGFSGRSAAVSCLFEVAERCAQMRAGNESIRVASLSELSGEGVDPGALLLGGSSPSPLEKVPLRDLDQNLPIAWVPALDLRRGGRRWLPAAYCYRSGQRAETAWSCPSDSTGCAAGLSVDDVVVRGVQEAVERDAVAIWWHNRISRPACSPAITELDPVRSIAIWLRRLGREFHILDLTSDLEIPVVAAVSHDKEGRGIAVGFGANFDPAGAAIRACLEMVQFLAMIQLSLRFRDLGHVPKPSAATSAAWEWFEQVSIDGEPYLLPNENAVPASVTSEVPANTAEAKERCLEITARRGLDLLFLDLMRPWIGIPAGRIVIPGLRSTKPRFGKGRLHDVPVQLSWLASPREIGEMNPRAMVF